MSKVVGAESPDKNKRFDFQVCTVPRNGSPEKDIHFHDELISPDIHVCLSLSRVNRYVPISWYGKPEYYALADVWRWGPNYFCEAMINLDVLFPDAKLKYKRVNNLAAFVKNDNGGNV